MTDEQATLTPVEIVRRTVQGAALNELSEQLHPVLRRVYAARGVSPQTADVALKNLVPVSELGGVQDAAEYLLNVLRNDGKVLVLGDFDADGATATALMVTCLRAFGFPEVSYMVPDRFKYGYGLSPEITELAATCFNTTRDVTPGTRAARRSSFALASDAT